MMAELLGKMAVLLKGKVERGMAVFSDALIEKEILEAEDIKKILGDG
ncbi:MAG: hypothetical protein AB1297_01700 [bacterium]